MFGWPLAKRRNSTNKVEAATAICSGKRPGVKALRRQSASSEPWLGPLTEVTEATCCGTVAAA
ncbi:hypothetical protein D3C80_2214930 [compost metagenome]